MPKLKKHSHIQRSPSQASKTQKNIIDLDTQAEYSTEIPGLYHPKPMKYSDRFKKSVNSTKQQLQLLQPSLQSSQQQPFELVSDGSMDKFMKKFTDDDEDINQIEVGIRVPKRRNTKSGKNEIKTKNKMFANLDFQSDRLEQPEEQSFQKLQIQVEKKQKRETFNLQKFQKKAESFKNKLQYKDLNKDDRYQKTLKDKLKSIQDGDELDIVVEVPKIFAGNKSQVEAAIFLKNHKISQESVQLSDYVSSQLNQDETSVPKDRKIYFAQFEKQMKMKKAQNITQSSIKECFKKSILDDKDFIPEFDDRDRQGNYDQFIESQKQEYSEKCNIRKSLDKEASNIQKNVEVSNSHEIQWQQQPKIDEHKHQVSKSERDTTFKEKDKKQYIIINDSSQEQKSKEISKNQASKPDKKGKVLRKNKCFAYKQLIEVEAELSDDEGEGCKHQDSGEDSSSGDDKDLESLIDDDYELNSHEKDDLHRKFVKDQMELQEKKFEEMRKKMESQYLQQQQRLKKRMEEAARKNFLKEKQENQKRNENYVQNGNVEKSNSSATSVTAERQKNMQKLRQLEEDLGKDNKPQRQKTQISRPSKLSKLEEIELDILNAHKNGMKKITRNGLKNIQVHQKNLKIKRVSK